ncbi:MAG: superinfection immunity protein [Rhodospirillales bacterium]|nr:superinfection immunity protein [Rhodospirillales bacterium]
MDPEAKMFLIACALLYLLPALIAMLRAHPNAAAIVALDLLLGWSLIGWVVALVWSLTAVRRRA